MSSRDVENLNLSDMDVDALEQRLETSLFMHPMLWDCAQAGCNTHTVVGL